MTPFSETLAGGYDAAWSATVASAAGNWAVAASEQLSAEPHNSGSRSGGPLGSAAVPTSSGATGKPRSGGGDDLTDEITAKCFAGMSSSDGSVEMLPLSCRVVSKMLSSLQLWFRPSNKPTRPMHKALYCTMSTTSSHSHVNKFRQKMEILTLFSQSLSWNTANKYSTPSISQLCA